MADKITTMFFEKERWTRAIDKGVTKDIRKDQLIKLCDETFRCDMASKIMNGAYKISPPHTAQIPKDTPGEFRTVYVNEPIDRVFLSIVNDMLFELMPEMIHLSCKSYQTGIGCGKVVQEVSREITKAHKGHIIGWKADFSKYFDSVPLFFVDKAFDRVEEKYGKSPIIQIVRDYYHSDIYFNEDNELVEKYQSLKQGCAVAAWLADVVLYELDSSLSKLNGYYVRYSDDTLFVGPDAEKAMAFMEKYLSGMDMKLNPKKVEQLRDDRWFKFLGFSIKGDKISLSSTRIKTFQKEIEKRTIKKRGITLERAKNLVNRYLWKGNGEYSWATQILPIVNVKEDIDELNMFVMDALRAVQTGKHKIGGLGYVKENTNNCIVRGVGQNVTANRQKTGKITGFLTLGCMQKALLTSKSLYNTLVANL